MNDELFLADQWTTFQSAQIVSLYLIASDGACANVYFIPWCFC